ncbi:Peptidase S54, rhomboid [Rhodopirellula maiorica SM1]|uniref:Peptidase S54, rhomboid n=1 Tax=Rhodopirellula maiorica SM1 TaxID=1265738 RepID=M5RGW1_9BACT|nr:rhomboid family intramembrane serine protease [Rhodopirellula maiorica]EMI18618.1 Peptidase S54, rhomboid [Rhodopirellula maiorica SM1]
MILIAPYTTDAPVYHLPIVTGGLVATNIVIFCLTTLQVALGNIEVESIEWLILQFDTINPLQWISCAFMHADLMHLLGNMLFLWAFGLVVEGKIGNLPFLALYLLMALVGGIIVQLPMFILGNEGGALGATGVIFSLLVIAMLWAPENEMDCFWLVGFRMGTFEVRIISLASAFLMMQLVFLAIGGFSMSSEMLHLIGVAVGLPIGLLMLRQDWVDCEGWDVVSRNAWLQEYNLFCSDKQRIAKSRQKSEHADPIAAALGKRPTPVAMNTAVASSPATAKAEPKAPQPAPKPSVNPLLARLRTKSNAPVVATEPPKPQDHPEFNRLVHLLRQAVDSSSAIIAQQHFLKLEQLKLSNGLSDTLLAAYAKLLASKKMYIEAIRPLTIMAIHGGVQSHQARLRIGQIQWTVQKNRQAATTTLRGIVIPPDARNEANQKVITMRDQLLKQISASQ